MQGERSVVSSLPESLGFDHGSTSMDAGMDQQICWNSVRNSPENVPPNCITSSSDTSGAYMNPMSQGARDVSGWYAGEPSSSGTRNHLSDDELKSEHGWPTAMVTCGGAGPLLEEQQIQPPNILSLNNANVNCSSNQIANVPLFVQSSSSAIPQDLNMSPGTVGHGSNGSYTMNCPNAWKSDGSENLRIPSASSSCDPFGVPSGTVGYTGEETDGRPSSSVDGRRISCKRKALEFHTGQSSTSESSSDFQQAGSSGWQAVPGRYNAGSSLSVSTSSENILGVGTSEQVNARLGLVARAAASESPIALNREGNVENSQRNYRMRISPSVEQDSAPLNIGSNLGHPNVPSQLQSSRLYPLNNSLEMVSPSTADNIVSQRQSVFVHVPASRRTSHSSRWNGGSSSRLGHSSGTEERDILPQEQSNSFSIPRNIVEHPMFIPANELGNSAQNSTNWSLTGGNINIPGNVASTSRTGLHQSSGSNLVPNRHPPQYPRRLSEIARRSLSSAGSDSGGRSSSSSLVRPVPSSQEMPLSSGAANRGHHLSRLRSAILIERQLENAFGEPYSLQTLAAASEGGSRIVSEIRNVLDLMRRGEGLQFEDVMILDQSVFFGMADVHDRHRDMRLDVDNMSYEELLALEERIGNVSTGLSEEIISNQLKQRKYFSIAMGAQLEVEPCCVCQEEYNDGEGIGTLDCGHEFHTGCIKQWLMHKNLCPICKTTAFSK
ncbi:E3 ubiquitin-protein ligase MBR2-like [Diospyros lotus]|uniref:E3 ubiquitin-protein ligase MBR2-like n=1 Tax=Diospyros lotus TaxID=55363 RepID=UPI002254052A|nr:E3 ubiquitin-protein ligase MBR2-like [Diospyros lotus]